MRNTIGELFSVTTFGESHGAVIGGVIDGVPAGVEIDVNAVQHELDRRRPGQSAITTSRNEPDKVEFLSGMLDGVTLGTPIGFIIRNHDHHSCDYSEIANCYRPSHADYVTEAKYGIRDARGGGRSSARETAARVVAGAIARQMLAKIGVTINAFTSQVGEIKLENAPLDIGQCEENMVRCPDEAVAGRMIAAIEQAKAEGDTLGGVVSCVIKGVPAGWGEPVFGKLHAELAHAMMTINAAKAFEYGLGFGFAASRGSETIDRFTVRDDGTIGTVTNNSGGIQGGISNGEDIYFNVVFKPVATLMRDIETIDRNGNPVVLKARGRHDPCVVPRAVPVVEAMAAIVLLDSYLLNKTSHL